MSARLIFPSLRLFKKTVTEHFLIALREIFKVHPAYTYIEGAPSNTNIHIEPTYANLTFEGKKPELLLKSGRYEFALQDTLNRNLFTEVKNSQGVVAGYRSLKNMITTMTVVSRAYAEEESSDLADELVMLGVYAAHSMFTQVGINIIGSSVSETTQTDSHNEIFDTIVHFQLEIPWQLETVSDDLPIGSEIEMELGKEKFDPGYRDPAVTIETEKG